MSFRVVSHSNQLLFNRVLLPWLVVAVIAAWLWLPNLFTEGMFVDGVINASVARKLAMGEGSFWDLRENYMNNGPYRGHPPLAFYLQSLFFKGFGVAFYIEKLYSLVTALVQMLLLVWGWRIWFSGKAEVAVHAWLPVLFWLVSPLTGWCYSSNMLENTQAMFTTASVFILAWWIKRGGNWLLYSVIACCLLMAAILTKGPLALFVLAMPILFTRSNQRPGIAHALMISSVLVFGLLALFILLFSYRPSYEFFQQYMQTQVAPALQSGQRSVTILSDLVVAISIPGLIAVVAYFYNAFKSKFGWTETVADALRWLALALAASVPIILSSKQSKFYLMPSVPFYAMSFAMLSYPVVPALFNKISVRFVAVANVLFILLLIFFVAQSSYQFGGVARYPELMKDVHETGNLVPEKSAVQLDWNTTDEYHLRAYLSRYYNITTHSPCDSCDQPLWLMDKNIFTGGPYQMLYQGNVTNLYRLKD